MQRDQWLYKPGVTGGFLNGTLRHTAWTKPGGTWWEGEMPGARYENLTPPVPPARVHQAPVLVLGVGDELLADGGLGLAAARRFAATRPGEFDAGDVEVLDVATLGRGLPAQVAGRDAILVLDAILAEDTAPGAIVILRGGEVSRAYAPPCSAHQTGLAEALAAAELAGRGPRRLAAVGVVPHRLETGPGLSPIVADRLGIVVTRARDVLREWGAEAVEPLRPARQCGCWCPGSA